MGRGAREIVEKREVLHAILWAMKLRRPPRKSLARLSDDSAPVVRVAFQI
jgi:hypothetical protein